MGHRLILSERSGDAAGYKTGTVAFRILFSKKCIKCSLTSNTSQNVKGEPVYFAMKQGALSTSEKRPARFLIMHIYHLPEPQGYPAPFLTHVHQRILFDRLVAPVQADDSTSFCGVYLRALSTPPPTKKESENGHRGGDKSEQNQSLALRSKGARGPVERSLLED